MKVYLDVSCLNRPFDDQAQPRIRIESEAVLIILAKIDAGEIEQVSSEMCVVEIDAIKTAYRRTRVKLLLPGERHILPLGKAVFERASEIQRLGFKPADAVHLAAAESGSADIFLTCDDRLCNAARRQATQLKTQVANPVEFLREGLS